MAHRYGEPVRVTVAKSEHGEQRPTSFTWRGWRYWVEIIGRRHLQDRWWDAERHSDEQYYRVVTPDHQVFDLYHDTVSGIWVLDVVHD